MKPLPFPRFRLRLYSFKYHDSLVCLGLPEKPFYEHDEAKLKASYARRLIHPMPLDVTMRRIIARFEAKTKL